MKKLRLNYPQVSQVLIESVFESTHEGLVVGLKTFSLLRISIIGIKLLGAIFILNEVGILSRLK